MQQVVSVAKKPLQGIFRDPGGTSSAKRGCNPHGIKARGLPRRNFATGHRVYVNNNPYRFADPDGRFIQAIFGAAIGIVVDVAAQQIVNGLGSEIDMVSVTASAALGAATAGVGAIYAQSAKIGAITATQAVSRTAAVNGAIGAAGSAAESIANGEAPDPSNMVVAGAMTMGLSAGAGRLSNAQAIRAEAISAAMPNSPAGIGGHIASTTGEFNFEVQRVCNSRTPRVA